MMSMCLEIMRRAFVHHNHRSVVEVSDALVVLFAFLQDEDAHNLAGQNDRLQRTREFVNIQDMNALDLGEFV